MKVNNSEMRKIAEIEFSRESVVREIIEFYLTDDNRIVKKNFVDWGVIKKERKKTYSYKKGLKEIYQIIVSRFKEFASKGELTKWLRGEGEFEFKFRAGLTTEIKIGRVLPEIGQELILLEMVRRLAGDVAEELKRSKLVG